MVSVHEERDMSSSSLSPTDPLSLVSRETNNSDKSTTTGGGGGGGPGLYNAIEQREERIVDLEREIALLRAANALTTNTMDKTSATTPVVCENTHGGRSCLNYYPKQKQKPKEHLKRTKSSRFEAEDEEDDQDSSHEGNLTQTLCAAVALAKEPVNCNSEDALFCDSAGEDLHHGSEKAFQQFFLISADLRSSPNIHTLEQRGSWYVDPFVLHSAEVLDGFPSGDPTFSIEPSLKGVTPYKAQLPPFCLPHGVRIRLVPRVALEGAKRLGWLGSSADQYHVLVFTDSQGTARHGVAITVHEEVHNPTLYKYVKYQRARRQAAVLISRCWRKHRKQWLANMTLTQRRLRRMSYSDIASSSSSGSASRNGRSGWHRCDDNISLTSSDSFRRTTKRRMSSSRNLFRSWPILERGRNRIENDHAGGNNNHNNNNNNNKNNKENNNNVAKDAGRRSSADRFLNRTAKSANNNNNDNHNHNHADASKVPDDSSISDDRSFCSVSGLSLSGMSVQSRTPVRNKTRRKDLPNNTTHNNVGVREILHQFLRSSPIPLYNKKKKTGVWRSAKVRFKTASNEYMVILAHYPLQMGSKEVAKGLAIKPYDYSHLYQEERMRLMELLKGVDSPPPGKSHVTEPCKVASITFHEVVGDEIVATNTVNVKGISPKELQAEEAYEEMLASEKIGDVMVVEKCYVLMGCEPSELCLLFAALQQVVNMDREVVDGVRRWSHDGQGGGALVKKHRQEKGTMEDDFASELKFLAPFSGRMKQQRQHGGTRHQVLSAIQGQLRLSTQQQQICLSDSSGVREEDFGKFELKLPFSGWKFQDIPLPLPQIAGEWGFATVLLRLGTNFLLKVLKVLLLERSVLILGESTEEVTSSTCALLELIRPYDWAGVFLPLLPKKMLELVHAPVPFVVGVTVDGADEVQKVEGDSRVKDAIREGMVLVNLSTGSLVMNDEDDSTLQPPQKLSETMESLKEDLKDTLKLPLSLYGSLQSFVQNGLSIEEKKILQTARNVILEYMTDLAGDLATENDAWKKYGVLDERTNRFDFCPSLFYDPLFAELQFRKQMAHTQMFSSFVHSRRNEDLQLNATHRGTTSNVLGNWMFNKWSAQSA